MSSSLLVLQLLLCSFSTSISKLPIDFPTNIVVQPELRPVVVELWAGSPTFRAQCQKIGQHRHYRVAIVHDPALSLNRACRAQCVLRIYTTGFVTARVMVPHNRHALVELIPHELEHVIERIDGVNVKRDALRPGSGAYDVGAGRVETLRATQVGRRARHEFEASREAVAVLSRR